MVVGNCNFVSEVGGSVLSSWVSGRVSYHHFTNFSISHSTIIIINKNK